MRDESSGPSTHTSSFNLLAPNIHIYLSPSYFIPHPSSFIEGIVYNRLRFVHDRIEVGLVLKTLRIDFVDVLGARGPGGEPTVGSHHFEATNRCAVTRCRG